MPPRRLPEPVLVLGAGGLVGGELLRVLGERAVRFAGRNRDECDITDPASVRRAVIETGAAIVLNCAADNAVDRAESERARADLVNRGGAENVARAAPAVLHYSTDYVFDGEKGTPYVESDAPRPLSVYARAKSEGDHAVARANPRHFILRVGCLYGRGGRNYGSTVLARLRRGERVRADADRKVQPTWARNVAEQSLAVLATDRYGLFHAMSHGETTWAEWTRELCRLAGLDASLVEPVPALAIPAAAPRPRYSILENRALASLGLDLMRPWREALTAYLEDVLSESNGGRAPSNDRSIDRRGQP